MNATLTIAANTFREAVRDRVLYLLVFFAALVIIGSEGMAALAVGSPDKIVIDIGLGAISFFGVILSVFLGLSVVSREIARRTVYTVVTKPIARSTFIFGKFLGLYATVVVVVVSMSVLFLGFVGIRYGVRDPMLLKSIYLSLIEDLVVACAALLFSSFTTPILGVLFTMTVYVIGHLSFGLRLLAELPTVRGTLVAPVSNVLYLVLPNLERFNIRAQAVHGELVAAADLIATTGYGVAYAAALLLLAMAVFSRRDFV